MARGANDNAARVQLGPFWLWYREDRDDWRICWYDDGGNGRSRRTCRKTTGIGGRVGSDGKPPQAAQDALADHYAAWRKPVEQAPDEAFVEGLFADWLEYVATADEAPERARYAVVPWLEFFEVERRAGLITRGPFVKDINRALVTRFIEWRKPQPGARHGSTVSGETINRELAALRAALRHAWQNDRIPSAPFIPNVAAKDMPAPKELTYTPKQIASLLEAAWRRPDRRHVHLFMMVMLSTHGRGNAILELDADSQIRDGLIYFNAPGRTQTKKRRSIVPIAPTLAPWLANRRGKLIRYRAEIARRKWADPEVPEYFEYPCSDIGRAFEACLVEAGITHQVQGANGELRTVGLGSPNTLRHTISTELHRRGVDERQIDQAAGHAPIGTNKKNYMHLRPGYLAALIDAVEDMWREIGTFTKVHLRSHSDPKMSLVEKFITDPVREIA